MHGPPIGTRSFCADGKPPDTSVLFFRNVVDPAYMRAPGRRGSPLVAHPPESMLASHSNGARGVHAFSHVNDGSCLYTGPEASFAAAVSTPIQRDSAQVVPAGGGGGGGKLVQS